MTTLKFRSLAMRVASGLFVLAALTCATPAKAAMLGVDNAANYTNWTNGSNGGTGFGAWDLTNNNNNGTTVFAGYFLGDSTAGTGNINTVGKSFGIYANPGAAFANASRTFAGGALSLGQTFSIQLAVNFRNGDKGINLLSGGTQVFNFNVGQAGTGTDGYYYQNGAGGPTNTGFAYYSDSVFFLSYLQQKATAAQLTLTRTSATGGTAATNSFTETLTTSGLSSFTLYNSNTGDGSSQNNLFFNNMQVVPEPSICVLAALGGTALTIMRRRRKS